MNRIFKTLWSHALQQYVVTNEKQANHGKAAKSIVMAVATATLAGAACAVDYVEPGKIGDKASWETSEYLVKDTDGNTPWSLKAMNASSAYALGFSGQGVKLGVMDSGALLTHSDLSGPRFSATELDQTNKSSGYRYPQSLKYTDGKLDESDAGKYEAGTTEHVSGGWKKEINDSHGTKVTGAMAANRDGQGMHGVAWSSDAVVANTGGNDSTNYGPFLDYNYFKQGWEALVAKGVAVINNSFGTNVKRDLSGVYLDLLTAKPSKESRFANYYDSGVVLTTIPDIEYEYFLFQKMYEPKGGKSFVDGAWEAVKGTDTIQVFTAGNNWRDNPYHRGLYPYFHPEAESNWISISGLAPDEEGTPDKPKYRLLAEDLTGKDPKISQGFNRAGYAKYWTLLSGGTLGYTTSVSKDGDAEYGSFGGTSMAAPLVSGAFGVLKSRYPSMTNKQAREVLFTTASHKNPDGSTMKGWTATEGEVDSRMGWGVPDLEKGMYGPGQLLGKFEYNLADATALDVWSNDISETALKQRQKEELDWLTSVSKEVAKLDGTDTVTADKGGNYKLVPLAPVKGVDELQENNTWKQGLSSVDPEKAKAWRQLYFDARANMINDKIKNGLYNGSLVKDGAGTLVMTGNNVYSGGTTVKNGSLYGFATSFGDATTKNDQTPNAGKVVVEGGTFGITPVFVDQLTLKGRLENKDHLEGKAAIEVKAPATLEVLVSTKALDGTTVEESKVQFLKVEDGATVRLSSLDWTKDSVPAVDTPENIQKLQAAKAEEHKLNLVQLVADNEKADYKIAGKITAADKVEVNKDKLAKVDYLKVKQDITVEGSSMTVTLSKKTNEEVKKTVEAMNLDDNSKAALAGLGSALGASAMTTDDVKNTMTSLASDQVANAQTASMLNSLSIADDVLAQLNGFGEATVVQKGEGTVWGNLKGFWGKVDMGYAKTKTQYTTGLVGAEMSVANDVKVGAFMGAGRGTLKADELGKTKTTDFHFGAYAHAKIAGVAKVSGGVMLTNEQRKMDRLLTVGKDSAMTNNKFRTNVVELFAEAACPGFTVGGVSVDPYVGLNWMHFQGKTWTDTVGQTSVTTQLKSQNVVVSSLGVRASVPFTVGAVSLKAKADLAWKHFFGDNRVEYAVKVGDQTANMKGAKLANTANVALGVEANVAKATTVGLSYQGAFGKKVHSNGLMATVRYTF